MVCAFLQQQGPSGVLLILRIWVTTTPPVLVAVQGCSAVLLTQHLRATSGDVVGGGALNHGCPCSQAGVSWSMSLVLSNSYPFLINRRGCVAFEHMFRVGADAHISLTEFRLLQTLHGQACPQSWLHTAGVVVAEHKHSCNNHSFHCNIPKCYFTLQAWWWQGEPFYKTTLCSQLVESNAFTQGSRFLLQVWHRVSTKAGRLCDTRRVLLEKVAAKELQRTVTALYCPRASAHLHKRPLPNTTHLCTVMQHCRSSGSIKSHCRRGDGGAGLQRARWRLCRVGRVFCSAGSSAGSAPATAV